MVDAFSDRRHEEAALTIQPAATAVLVVDMLNDFCLEGGAMALPGAEALYGPQNALIGAARQAGSVIVFVNDCHRPELRRDREFLKRRPIASKAPGAPAWSRRWTGKAATYRSRSAGSPVSSIPTLISA